MEIKDSGIFVSETVWHSAQMQTTATAFARVLLMGLFSVDVLVNSNLTGGASKTVEGSERRQALDRSKVGAIIGE